MWRARRRTLQIGDHGLVLATSCSVATETHLFGEPGALDEVARLATSWFVDHVPAHAKEAS